MRRHDRAISLEEARSLLEEAEYGVLSMAGPDGVPHGIALNFALAGIAFNSTVLRRARRSLFSRRTRESRFAWLAAPRCYPISSGPITKVLLPTAQSRISLPRKGERAWSYWSVITRPTASKRGWSTLISSSARPRFSGSGWSQSRARLASDQSSLPSG